MSVQARITYRKVPESAVLSRRILERVAHLERAFPRVQGCEVTVESPHRSHRKGNAFRLRVGVKVPGRELVVSREPKEVYAAVQDAFRAIERQLRELKRHYGHENIHSLSE